MNKTEIENLRICIESCIGHIMSEREDGNEQITSLLDRYHATCIEDLSPSLYDVVYNELDFMELDLK